MGEVVLMPGGPRARMLHRLAYEEEGLPCPDVDERISPTRLLFPRSFIEGVDEMPGDKTHDYCFMGTLYRSETFTHRDWILSFARRRFTDRSFLLLSESPDGHEHLGPFDHTGEAGGVFVPKEVPEDERAFFNPPYFAALRHSQFALCPAGDLPWSLRFFEAIMCRSIPIVEHLDHTGRNELERSVGYTVLLRDDEHIFDERIVEENHRLFLHHQSLIGATT